MLPPSTPESFNPSTINFDPWTLISFLVGVLVNLVIYQAMIHQLNSASQNEVSPWYISLKKAIKNLLSFMFTTLLFILLYTGILLVTITIAGLSALVLSVLLKLISPTFFSSDTLNVLGLLGVVILSIGVPIFLLKWYFYPMAFCVDNKKGKEALKYSFKLTRGWKNTFGTVLLFGVMIIISLILFLPFFFLVNNNLLYSLIVALIDIIFYPWGVSCFLCWYRTLQQRA